MLIAASLLAWCVAPPVLAREYDAGLSIWFDSPASRKQEKHPLSDPSPEDRESSLNPYNHHVTIAVTHPLEPNLIQLRFFGTDGQAPNVRISQTTGLG